MTSADATATSVIMMTRTARVERRRAPADGDDQGMDSLGADARPIDRPFAADPGMIAHGDAAWKAFAAVGWSWGGDWSSLKDYMHFSANGLRRGRGSERPITGWTIGS